MLCEVFPEVAFLGIHSMSQCSAGGIPCLRFPQITGLPGFYHGVFTRHGGVSPPPFDSLNISYAVGDDPACVDENLRRLREAAGTENLCFMDQRHGTGVVVLESRVSQGFSDAPPEADAMITDIPFAGLLVKQADCQAVILYDPEKAVAANVHCGWRGNVHNIIGTTVETMTERFGCDSDVLMAVVGPSLGPCCAQFVDYRELFPRSFTRFMLREGFFDLWAISCSQLLEAGLRQERISVAGICTRCHPELFYSYRGEGRTGRFGTVVMLTPG